MDISQRVGQLVDYAVRTDLIDKTDKIYMTNRIMAELGISDHFPSAFAGEAELEDILGDICDHAYQKGLIDGNTDTQRDLFDTRLMGILTPRPSEVIRTFKEKYSVSPECATDYYYALSRNSDYIRTYRIRKDLKWTYPSEYGEIDITVNLSKPEKDPKAIAKAKSSSDTGYPKCAICIENEGFAGNALRPARQNHRIIPLTLGTEQWCFQYSPYVYYNEHCILFNSEHTPMKIDRATFERQLDFVAMFPHYFIGSNADLPIVGGSILSHDHMQGGRYTFAIERAEIEKELFFDGFSDVSAGLVRWPMSVIRLSSYNKDSILELADRILTAWRGYTDEEAFIFAETDGEEHNTITPVARIRDGKFELDLVLRNNITTKERPFGLYNTRAELHNIKRENIGIIEVMGLAVLPPRLNREISLMREYILEGRDLSEDEETSKHSAWFEEFRNKYEFTPENTEGILRAEIGASFVRALEDSGVYKRTENGQRAFLKFIENI